MTIPGICINFSRNIKHTYDDINLKETQLEEAASIYTDGKDDDGYQDIELDVNIPGIDGEFGLSLYGWEADMYLSALRSFAANVPAVLDKIRDVSEETLPAYEVEVHGIKGTSSSIGAESVREKAATLEKLSKAGDISGVLEKNGEMLAETEKLIADIREWLKKNDI